MQNGRPLSPPKDNLLYLLLKSALEPDHRVVFFGAETILQKYQLMNKRIAPMQRQSREGSSSVPRSKVRLVLSGKGLGKTLQEAAYTTCK